MGLFFRILSARPKGRDLRLAEEEEDEVGLVAGWAGVCGEA